MKVLASGQTERFRTFVADIWDYRPYRFTGVLLDIYDDCTYLFCVCVFVLRCHFHDVFMMRVDVGGAVLC